MWVTAHGPEPRVDEVNRAIASVMGGLPNGAILDWDRLVPPDELSSDGVHPLAGHEGLLASFLTPMLQTWRDAVEGRGPTRCDREVAALAAG